MRIGLIVLVSLLFAAAAVAQDSADTIRFATFNASLNRSEAGQLIADLSTPDNEQAQNVAHIIQIVRPDVLLINEFDYDAEGEALRLFHDNYLNVAQGDADPIAYPYSYAAPSNTGIPAEMDFNNDDQVGGPDDAFGFGFFPGQFAFVVYSLHPIDMDNLRTFQNFLWQDMPTNLLPTEFYSAEEAAIFRLSSKNHVDVPLLIGDSVVHFLVSHPTPPVFDGEEDRNGRRNFDEIRLWADYIDNAEYIYDDAGVVGGLANDARFVIAGDQNSDPLDGDSIEGAAQLLLDHPRVNTSLTPASEGAVEAAAVQGGANTDHESDPQFDTADFNDESPGNLRADYVLPSANLTLVDAGVYWLPSDDPLAALAAASDHRLVWIDVSLAAE